MLGSTRVQHKIKWERRGGWGRDEIVKSPLSRRAATAAWQKWNEKLF